MVAENSGKGETGETGAPETIGDQEGEGSQTPEVGFSEVD